MPTRSQRISLAAALLDFPAAPGYSTPQQHAPDSWLELFTSKHADGEVFLGIFRSCRAGRDLVLRAAPQARLRLDCTASQSLAGWMRQLTAVWAGLRTRGAQQAGHAPTSLTIIRENRTDSDIAVAMLLYSLHQAEAGHGIKAFSLQTSDGEPVRGYQPVSANYLEAFALALPNLTSLTVNHCSARLPPPSNLPHLTHIYIVSESEAADKVCSSIAPYLTQIQSLHLTSHTPDLDSESDDWEDNPYDPWHTLFQPQQVTHTLTTLCASAPMSDELVRLILTHAPALRDLTVGGEEMALEQDWAGQGKEWGVQRLYLGLGQDEPWVGPESLARLPKTRQGQGPLLVEGVNLNVVFTVTGEEASDLRLAERMPSWQFKLNSIDLWWEPIDPNHPPDPTEAQCRMLRTLSLLAQPSSGAVMLHQWEFTAESLHVLAELLPSLGDLQFNVDLNKPLTDALLGAVLRLGGDGLGSRVGVPSFRSLALESDQHASAPWPWPRFVCNWLDMGQLHKLPRLRRGQECVVTELIVGEDTEELSDHVEQTCVRLRDIVFAPRYDKETIPMYMTVRCREPHALLHPSQVAILRNIQTEPKCKRVLALQDYSLTQEGVRGLSALPDWEGATLDLSECGFWPLPEAQYAHELLQFVPEGYDTWRFPNSKMHQKLRGLMRKGRDSVRSGVTVEIK